MRTHGRWIAVGVFALALGLATLGCSKSDQSEVRTDAGSATQAPSSGVQVSRVDLGKSADANKRVTVPVTIFAPSDPIVASVITTGSGATELRARWTFQDGKVVEETVQTISPAGGEEATEFRITKPEGFAPGQYKLEVFVNGQPAGMTQFEVKAG